MNMLKNLKEKKVKLAVVGLGYVGLPLAAAFAEKFDCIGYDNNSHKIAEYLEGHDPTDELGDEALKDAPIKFTDDARRLEEARFVIIAVPTPIKDDKTPDLGPVIGATATAGEHLKRGSIVVYESTVYPGVTEEICVPILEEKSGLKCGTDFKVGYSPERINPGDKVHRLKNIVKIVSGMDDDALADIADVYDTVIYKTYRAPSIRVAEAAKLVENAQRDINIAFMNELAVVFHRMNIDTNDVLKAMNTKWNALGFRPGLVGGHCIGVDPYYFIYEAEMLGYHSQIISAGRRVNNFMSEFVANETIKTLIRAKIDVSKAKIYLLGMTFKEDTPDIRNSRAVDVYKALEGFGIEPIAVDPTADPDEFLSAYGFPLVPMSDVHDADCLVFLVAHRAFRELRENDIAKLFSERARKNNRAALIDVKSMYDRRAAESAGYIYWSL